MKAASRSALLSDSRITQEPLTGATPTVVLINRCLLLLRGHIIWNFSA